MSGGEAWQRSEESSGIDVRTRALTYCTGQSRAYLEQLALMRRELTVVGGEELVLRAVEASEVVVAALNDIASARLRPSTTDGRE